MRIARLNVVDLEFLEGSFARKVDNEPGVFIDTECDSHVYTRAMGRVTHEPLSDQAFAVAQEAMYEVPREHKVSENDYAEEETGGGASTDRAASTSHLTRLGGRKRKTRFIVSKGAQVHPCDRCYSTSNGYPRRTNLESES